MEIIQRQKKTIKNQSVKFFMYKKQVGTLRSEIKNLKKQGMISDEGATVLDSVASRIPADISKCLERNQKTEKVSRVEYLPVLRSFALTRQILFKQSL